MVENITYVALDDHKKRHQVAVLLPGMEREEARTWRIENTRSGIRKMVRKVLRMAPGDVRVCYEAGPNGYTLQRQISKFDRVSCVVVAPSKTPPLSTPETTHPVGGVSSTAKAAVSGGGATSMATVNP